MPLQTALDKLLEGFDSDLSSVQARYSRRFSAIVNRRVSSWNSRFHRHHIEAWEGHGLLSFWVVPGFGGARHTPLELEDPRDLRGAWRELAEEARLLVDSFNSTSTRRPLSYFSED